MLFSISDTRFIVFVSFFLRYVLFVSVRADCDLPCYRISYKN